VLLEFAKRLIAAEIHDWCHRTKIEHRRERCQCNLM